MKPIILVILGAAMLMPMMHQSNNSSNNLNAQPQVKQTRQAPQFNTKRDSEATLHMVDFVTDRLQ